MGFISWTRAGTMSGFGADSKLAHHRNACVCIADPHFALTMEVIFTLTTRAKQE